MIFPGLIGAVFLLSTMGAKAIVSTDRLLVQVDPRAIKIQDYLEYLEASNRFMGTVSLSIGEEEIANSHVGVYLSGGPCISLGDIVRANRDTQYRVGSITKTFTSVIILQLIEEGRLALDTKLAEFYPDVRNSDEVTIEHMLRHRSGIHDFTRDQTYSRWQTMPQTRELILARFKQKSDFVPGKKFQYSNSNYVLLGYIIEDLSRNSYGNELKKRITDRIGLNRTAVMVPADLEQNVALSYSWKKNEWTPHSETHPTVPHGAGVIMSTARDLTVFIESLFAGKLIKASSLESMTRLVDGYGMGIRYVQFDSKLGLGHDGGIDGFQSQLSYFEEEKKLQSL
jgi:D-alanyl-D-alanine carboxypeptidase